MLVKQCEQKGIHIYERCVNKKMIPQPIQEILETIAQALLPEISLSDLITTPPPAPPPPHVWSSKYLLPQYDG